MTLRFQSGLVKNALLLSRGEDVIRVALEDQEDAIEISRLNGVWVTQECEPVELGHAEPDRPSSTQDDADCICPPEVVAQLIHLLFSGDDEQEPSPPSAADVAGAPTAGALM
jgi:hypothetical protein